VIAEIKMNVNNKDFAPILLLLISTALMVASIALKSMLVIAGATGLVIAWFLCIDKLLSASRLSLAAKILFAGAVIGLPVFVSVIMG
jgi:hypothetical protein